MEKKFDRAVLFFLIAALGITILGIFNMHFAHFLLELVSIFIGILIFIVIVNSSIYTQKKVLLSLGVAYLYVGIFDFLHIMYSGNVSFLVDNVNQSIQFLMNARIIESMSFFMVLYLSRKQENINYFATQLVLSLYTVIYVTLIIHDFLPPLMDGTNPTMLKYFVELFVIVVYFGAILLSIKAPINKKTKQVFLYTLILKLVSQILMALSFTYGDTVYLLAHVIRFLSWIGLYQIFVYRNIRDPYKNVYDLFDNETKKLKRMAETDLLTGIYNHTTTFSKLDVMIEKVINKNTIAVVLIDIDDFKIVNDTYGHQKGDELLRSFAQVLLTCEMDNKVVGRYGGDEFIIACSGMSKDLVEKQISIMTKKLREMMSEVEIDVTFSAGVAFYEEGDHTTDLIYKADIKMYEAKRLGKNRYLIW